MQTKRQSKPAGRPRVYSGTRRKGLSHATTAEAVPEERTLEVSHEVLRMLAERHEAPVSAPPASPPPLPTFGMLQRADALLLEEQLRIILDVLRNLSYVHQDQGRSGSGPAGNLVTPDRILIAANGSGRLMQGDEDRSSLSSWVQLRSYLAPEVLLKDPSVDQRADVYSVGVLLWECLRGETSQMQERASGILDSMLDRKLQRPKLPKSCDWAEPVIDVALRALALDPERRWQTSSEMATALLNACGDRLATRQALQMTLAEWASSHGAGVVLHDPDEAETLRPARQVVPAEALPSEPRWRPPKLPTDLGDTPPDSTAEIASLPPRATARTLVLVLLSVALLSAASYIVSRLML